MKNFNGKFEFLAETAIKRFQAGGILSNDVVKIRKDALKNKKVLELTDVYRKELEAAMNTDCNLRVGAVKSNKQTRDFWADIVIEIAPGLWRNPITVPIEILELVDLQGNLAPVPDSHKRKSVVEGPKEVESPDADRRTPDKDTKQKFIGNATDGRTQISKAKETTRKNQGKLTLEDVYGGMMSGDPTEKQIKKYTIKFGQPYGKNPDAIISKIQTMEGLSNNMDNNWVDDNTLKIQFSGDIDADTLRKMITNVVDGSVDVSEDIDMTEFTPKSAEIASGSPSIGA